jgi:hypothetical protein
VVPSRPSVAGIAGVRPPIDHLVSPPLMMALQRPGNLLGFLLMLNIACFNSGPLSAGSKKTFIGPINCRFWFWWQNWSRVLPPHL